MDVTRVCNWCICVTVDGQLAAPLVVSLLSIVVHIHIKCMTKVVKALEGIISLKAPVPPMLSDAIGYTGKERFVAFQWTPYGDEVEFADGRIMATGTWHLNDALPISGGCGPVRSGHVPRMRRRDPRRHAHRPRAPHSLPTQKP